MSGKQAEARALWARSLARSPDSKPLRATIERLTGTKMDPRAQARGCRPPSRRQPSRRSRPHPNPLQARPSRVVSHAAPARASRSPAGVVLLALAGCRTAPPPARDHRARRRRALARATRRARRSSSATRSPAASRSRPTAQGFSGTLRYQQQARRADLALDGPLGIGGMRVALDGEQLSITTSGGEHLDGAAARAELEQRLGFELPLAELRWWLLGIPAPGEVEPSTQDAGQRRDPRLPAERLAREHRDARAGPGLLAAASALHRRARGRALKLLVEQLAAVSGRSMTLSGRRRPSST